MAQPLWKKVYWRASRLSGRAEKFHTDVESFIKYKWLCDEVRIKKSELDIEEFLDFLDIEFALNLRGSDTFGPNGNETQIIVKTLIGQILNEAMPSIEKIPDLYLKFANTLDARDIVLTFNYDTLLERALEAAGKPYRLMLNNGTQLASDNDVIILKLRGSIDWFNKNHVGKRFWKDTLERMQLEPIQTCSSLTESSLTATYRIRDLDRFYEDPPWFKATPLIILPSRSKVIFARERRELWHGLGQHGAYNFRMGIIGYSLPKHDEYVRQLLYRIITRYQNVLDPLGDGVSRKRPVTFIDYRTRPCDVASYKERYRFSNESMSVFDFTGFRDQSLERLI